jgi:hypothetical protein
VSTLLAGHLRRSHLTQLGIYRHHQCVTSPWLPRADRI